MSLSRTRWLDHANVTQALPPLHTLDIAITVPVAIDDIEQSRPLTDPLLSQLLRCVTSADILSVPDIRLQTAVPEGTVLPWAKVKVTEMHGGAAELFEQAQLLGKTRWDLGSCDIDLSMEQVCAETRKTYAKLADCVVSRTHQA